jgi:hypothetical protein
MWGTVGLLLVSLLFGVIGFYLSLIAKFYRLKFGRGPRAAWLQASLLVTVAGLVLKIEAFAAPSWLPAALASAGALLFSALIYRLYRTMMSAG